MHGAKWGTKKNTVKNKLLTVSKYCLFLRNAINEK
jgi:hypothetical protein